MRQKENNTNSKNVHISNYWSNDETRPTNNNLQKVKSENLYQYYKSDSEVRNNNVSDNDLKSSQETSGWSTGDKRGSKKRLDIIARINRFISDDKKRDRQSTVLDNSDVGEYRISKNDTKSRSHGRKVLESELSGEENDEVHKRHTKIKRKEEKKDKESEKLRKQQEKKAKKHDKKEKEKGDQEKDKKEKKDRKDNRIKKDESTIGITRSQEIEIELNQKEEKKKRTKEKQEKKERRALKEKLKLERIEQEKKEKKDKKEKREREKKEMKSIREQKQSEKVKMISESLSKQIFMSNSKSLHKESSQDMIPVTVSIFLNIFLLLFFYIYLNSYVYLIF